MVSRGLIWFAAWLLPKAKRERFSDEWFGDLASAGTRWSKTLFAVGVVKSSVLIRAAQIPAYKRAIIWLTSLVLLRFETNSTSWVFIFPFVGVLILSLLWQQSKNRGGYMRIPLVYLLSGLGANALMLSPVIVSVRVPDFQLSPLVGSIKSLNPSLWTMTALAIFVLAFASILLTVMGFIFAFRTTQLCATYFSLCGFVIFALTYLPIFVCQVGLEMVYALPDGGVGMLKPEFQLPITKSGLLNPELFQQVSFLFLALIPFLVGSSRFSLIKPTPFQLAK